MSKKLEDLSGWELMGALAELAEPVGNLAEDDEIWECFRECTKNAWQLRQKDGFRYLLKTYSKLFPLLMGEKHKRDTIKILAIVSGKPVSEAMSMNGAELIKDFGAIYKEQLEPFFIKSALSQKTE